MPNIRVVAAHQLRGSGRAWRRSVILCLVTGYKPTEDTRKRLEIMVRTNDGFEIAVGRLKTPGPGDLESTQQKWYGIRFKMPLTARRTIVAVRSRNSNFYC